MNLNGAQQEISTIATSMPEWMLDNASLAFVIYLATSLSFLVLHTPPISCLPSAVCYNFFLVDLSLQQNREICVNSSHCLSYIRDSHKQTWHSLTEGNSYSVYNFTGALTPMN